MSQFSSGGVWDTRDWLFGWLVDGNGGCSDGGVVVVIIVLCYSMVMVIITYMYSTYRREKERNSSKERESRLDRQTYTLF